MAWLSSSFCESHACVEAAYFPAKDRVYLRQNVDGKVSNALAITVAEWEAFVGGVCNGDFDGLMEAYEEVPPGW